MDSEPAWQQRADASFWQEEELRADTVSQSLMRRSLTKNQIIRKKADIDNVMKAGKRQSLSCFKLSVAKNDLPYSRLIVIPVRHYGNSVQRNRIRRQIKEIWRTNQERIQRGLDFAVVVYPSDGSAMTFEDKKTLILNLIERSGSLVG